jgi:hypothetical protein
MQMTLLISTRSREERIHEFQQITQNDPIIGWLKSPSSGSWISHQDKPAGWLKEIRVLSTIFSHGKPNQQDNNYMIIQQITSTI